MTETPTFPEVTDEELGLTQKTNTPPGKSLEHQDTVLKKGDIIAQYNGNLDIWHVKRVVKASRPDPWRSYNAGQINQSSIYSVTHDAVPVEGKSGVAYAHYPTGGGYSETSSRSLAKDGANSWWLVDTTSSRAADWIAQQDALWDEHAGNVRAKEAHLHGTPEAFERRMEARAIHCEEMSRRARNLAHAFTEMAEEIRTETRGTWIK